MFAGKRKMGLDGTFYISRVTANGNWRWVKMASNKENMKLPSNRSKYQNRPSPPFPANDYCARRKVGNDGRLYESRPDKRGVCHWKPVR